MVRIVDGEILADDDPRATGRSPAAGPRGAAGRPPPAPPAARPGFDWNAAPLRLVPDEDGTGLGGLPNLLVFGLLVRPQHLLMLLAAGVFFGWRGLLVGAILFYVYTANQQPAAGPSQGQRMAAAQNYFTDVLGQAPLGRGGAAAASGREGAADAWAGRGRPRKLSES